MTVSKWIVCGILPAWGESFAISNFSQRMGPRQLHMWFSMRAAQILLSVNTENESFCEEGFLLWLKGAKSSLMIERNRRHNSEELKPDYYKQRQSSM